MTNFFASKFARVLPIVAALMFSACSQAASLPNAKVDTARAAGPTQTIVLAGGCFWGVQAVFKHVKGVTRATSGYAGGAADTAKYEIVSSGTTGHAESVQVVYDPSKITLGQILQVFFSVAHDPTQLNYQGPDHGTQYRSAIFFTNAEQQRVSQAYIAQLEAAKVFGRPIVTEVSPLKAFYQAEAYHQDYAERNPTQSYIARYDMPKLADLKAEFPDLYVGR